MTKKEKAKYSEKKPIAVYPLSNWGGVEILEFIYGTDDYVVARYYGKSYHRVKINGNSFRIGRLTINLSDCMNV